jgi:hypothetical protein
MMVIMFADVLGRDKLKASRKGLLTLTIVVVIFLAGRHVPVPWLFVDNTYGQGEWQLKLAQQLFSVGWFGRSQAVAYGQLLMIALAALKLGSFVPGDLAKPFSRLVIAAALLFCFYEALKISNAVLNVNGSSINFSHSTFVLAAVTMVGGAAILILLGKVLEGRDLGSGFWCWPLLLAICELPSEIASQLEFFSVSNAQSGAIFSSVLLQLALLFAPISIMGFRYQNSPKPFEPVLMIWLVSLLASGLAYQAMAFFMKEQWPDQWVQFEYGPEVSLLLRAILMMVISWFAVFRNEKRNVAAVTIALLIAYMVAEDTVYANFDVKISLYGLPALVLAVLAVRLCNVVKDISQKRQLASAFAPRSAK